METLTFSLLNGVLYGMLLFVLASGLTLIFSMMGVLNFAHASFFMVGAYLGYALSQSLGFAMALWLAPLLVGVLGAAVERYGLRAVHKYGHMAELLFTIGLSLLLEELVQLAWGRSPVDYRTPAGLDFTAFTLWGVGYPAFRVFILLVSAVVFALLFSVLKKTRLGLIVQASLVQPKMVMMLGHNVPRIFMLVFAAGCALAGLAGVIAGPILVTQPSMAASMGPSLFVIVVVGGLGSLAGAFIASLLVACLQTFAVAINWSVGSVFDAIGIIEAPAALGPIWGITIAQIGPLIPYLLLVFVLVAKPNGLFGARRT